MFLAALATYFGVKEDFTPIEKDSQQAKQSAFAGIKNLWIVWAMIISSMLIQAATNSINPILSLFVRELMHGTGNIAWVSGGVIAALLESPHWRRLHDWELWVIELGLEKY